MYSKICKVENDVQERPTSAFEVVKQLNNLPIFDIIIIVRVSKMYHFLSSMTEILESDKSV